MRSLLLSEKVFLQGGSAALEECATSLEEQVLVKMKTPRKFVLNIAEVDNE